MKRCVGGPARGSAGFTLLEVLIAFAILAVAVVAVIQGFAQGLRLLKAAGDHQRAVLLADQKAREVVVPTEGHDRGQEGAFDWERTVTVVKAPDLERTPASRKWRVYQIGVTVRWGDRRGVDVVTLRTATEPRQTATEPLRTTTQPLRPATEPLRPASEPLRPATEQPPTRMRR